MKLRQVLLTIAMFEVIAFTLTRLLWPEQIDRMSSCLLTIAQ